MTETSDIDEIVRRTLIGDRARDIELSRSYEGYALLAAATRVIESTDIEVIDLRAQIATLKKEKEILMTENKALDVRAQAAENEAEVLRKQANRLQVQMKSFANKFVDVDKREKTLVSITEKIYPENAFYCGTADFAIVLPDSSRGLPAIERYVFVCKNRSLTWYVSYDSQIPAGEIRPEDVLCQAIRARFCIRFVRHTDDNRFVLLLNTEDNFNRWFFALRYAGFIQQLNPDSNQTIPTNIKDALSDQVNDALEDRVRDQMRVMGLDDKTNQQLNATQNVLKNALQ